MTAESQPQLAEYLQRVVGRHGRVAITSVTRYDSWAELPWDDTLALNPLPEGPALLIGMQDMYLGLPGPEAFIALPELGVLQLGAVLAQHVIRARTGGKGY